MSKSNLKNKILSLLLVMTLVITIVPMNVFATERTEETVVSEGTYEDLTYSIINNEVAITGCSTFASGSIHIPSELEGYPVTCIYGDAFINCTEVTRIYIPGTVTKIESGAFSWVGNLEGIYVDEENQNYCSENGVLFNKNKTSLLRAPRTLTEYVIPNTVTEIGESAFGGCKNLSKVTIGENVTSIGSSAFYECTSLTSIKIPDSVRTIEGSAFYRCTNLSNVEFGNSVTEILGYAFNYCYSLTSISLPDSVTNIERAFNQCTSLTSIDLGEGVTSLNYRAFWGCSELSSITIGSKFKRVGSDAFEGCESLINVYYYGTEEQWQKVTISDGNFYLVERATVHYVHDCQWDEGTVTKEPSCTEEGIVLFKCKDCFATKKEVQTKLGHDYEEEWTVDKEATCTEEGSKSHHCSRCDATTDVTVMDALSSTGHQYSEEWVIDKEATCTKAGSKSRHCTICGAKSEITEIPVLNHSYGAWVVVKEATCTKTGSRYKECICGHKVTETISATGHDLGEIIVVREPTCYDFGETHQYCKNCNYVFYEYPNAIKHIENEKPVIKPATYSHGGDIEYFCKICKNSVRCEYIPHLSTSYLSKEAYVYDGSIKKPSVIVKNDAGDTLKNNIDYTVSYSSGRIKIGKYKVTIKYKGKYSGTDTHYFYIVPNLSAPKKVSATLFGHDDVKITWSSVKNADAYRIYYKKSGGSYKLLKTTTSLSYKKSNLSDGIKYYFKIVPCTYKNGYFYDDDSYKTTSIYTLKKVAGVKVVKSSSKVKVSWTNISGETGYQISKSTKKSGTSIVATYKTTSGKSKNISATKGKTYYYKVRAYKVVDGKKIYGPWSSVIKYKR